MLHGLSADLRKWVNAIREYEKYVALLRSGSCEIGDDLHHKASRVEKAEARFVKGLKDRLEEGS